MSNTSAVEWRHWLKACRVSKHTWRSLPPDLLPHHSIDPRRGILIFEDADAWFDRTMAPILREEAR